MPFLYDTKVIASLLYDLPNTSLGKVFETTTTSKDFLNPKPRQDDQKNKEKEAEPSSSTGTEEETAKEEKEEQKTTSNQSMNTKVGSQKGTLTTQPMTPI